MNWRCAFGRHKVVPDWPFSKTFVWITATTKSAPYLNWYQESRCSRCGKTWLKEVDQVWASRQLEKRAAEEATSVPAGNAANTLTEATK